MAIEKKQKSRNTVNAEELKTDSSWRKPITLDVVDDEDDPLAILYRGREVAGKISDDPALPRKAKDESKKPAVEKSQISEKPKEAKDASELDGENTVETPNNETNNQEKQTKETPTTRRVTGPELNAALKIKSETFHFTDIREILRGKSLDMYAYLRLLCGSEDVCKIKHLDLMSKLDISRPTLFKQGEWLTRLALIEKRNVPGDHLGTSYTVRRLEDVLPVSDSLVEQLESHIGMLRQIST